MGPFSSVVDILKLGLSGLVFLLAYLGYRLLSREQAKDKPNKSTFRNIIVFNVFAFLSALLVGVLSLIQVWASRDPVAAACRDSFSRLKTTSTLGGVTTDDLRAAIQTHEGSCQGLLDR
jgi:predicted permease